MSSCSPSPLSLLLIVGFLSSCRPKPSSSGWWIASASDGLPDKKKKKKCQKWQWLTEELTSTKTKSVFRIAGDGDGDGNHYSGDLGQSSEVRGAGRGAALAPKEGE